MKVSMIGLGKLGLPCAQQMASKHDVLGYDIRPIADAGLPIADSIQSAVKDRDLVFVAVPTPHDKRYDGSQPISQLPPKDFDYTLVKQVLKEVGKHTAPGQTVVLISTVLPGTLRREILPVISNYELIYNPYFIAMGSVAEDFLSPEFMTIGTQDGDEKKVALLLDFYKSLISDLKTHIGTWEEGECIKIFYNTFISFKLSFVNMIQDVSQKLGHMNVDVVTRALCDGHKRLLSPMYMTAGMGDGGPCHPRDNIALSSLVKQLELGYDLFSAVISSREMQAANLARFLVSFGRPVTIVGKSFKPGVPFVDGSYSLLVGHYVESANTRLSYLDPATGDKGLDEAIAQTYLLAHNDSKLHSTPFIAGSVVVDPWRKCPPLKNCEVIYYGSNRIKNDEHSIPEQRLAEI